MNPNCDQDNNGRRWASGWLVGSVIAFISSLVFAHFSWAFVLSSLIVICVALSIHIYRRNHPSPQLDLLLMVIVVMGFEVIKANISGVGICEAALYYSFSLALFSALTLFNYRRSGRRTGL
jgi:hypothetical protein